MQEPLSDLHEYAAFVGIDWADREHVFGLQVAGEHQVEIGVLAQTPEALGSWVAKLQKRFGGHPVAIALEQSRGGLIHALMNYDFLVLYPLHPTTVASFRQAFKSSGAKNDPLDARDILEILTKHRERLRPLNPDTEPTRLLRRLVEDRRKAVDGRTQHVEALHASTKEYFPQYIELVNGTLDSRLAGDFLQKWPTFELFQQAKPTTIRQFYYGHNIRSPAVVQKALDVAKTGQTLTTDGAILEGGQRLSQWHAELIQCLNRAIEDYEQRIKEVFNDYSEAYLFSKLPGAGRAMAPRLAAFFGTDRSHYAAAANVQCFTGIAPITKQSGRTKVVHARWACPKFDRQTFHEFARLSLPKCQWAQNYVTYYTQKGKSYQVILRSLAFKWIRILFRCWQTRTPYDDAKYLATLKKRGSPFATLHLKNSA